MANIIRLGKESPLVHLIPEIRDFQNPVVYAREPVEYISDEDEPPYEPNCTTNFHVDKLGWYVMAIEKYGYPGIYIEENAYTPAGYKLYNHYALMRVGSYDMADFWHIFDELREKYPVCPEVSIQDVGFGQSFECQKLIDEMRRKM